MYFTLLFGVKKVIIKKKVFLINPFTVSVGFFRYFSIILPIFKMVDFEVFPVHLKPNGYAHSIQG